MVEKVILENVRIILIINYTTLVFYFAFTVYFIITKIIACPCFIYKVKYLAKGRQCLFFVKVGCFLAKTKCFIDYS